MRAYHVQNLRTQAAVAPEQLAASFGAGWRAVELVTLRADERLGPRELSESEVVLFVTAGGGVARLPSGDVDLVPGLSLALMRGETLLIEQRGAEPLEFFRAELRA
jgi:mannose-6-phosphate isomerase-like protein (cupin superfamily)